MLALLLAVVLAIAGYLGYVGVRRSLPRELPAPTGSYRVGRAAFDWTDTGRVDPLAPRRGVHRELSVWLWYPAPHGATGKRAPYVPGEWHALQPSSLGPGFLEGSLDAIRDHSIQDAPIAAGRFPLVVLEPGLGVAIPNYATLAENLASHGYVVAGVTPTYSANVTVLHGHVVPASSLGKPPENRFTDANAARIVGVWAADAHFAVRQVAKLDGGTRFAGRIDLARIAYVGHSLGGATALQACRADPQCRGAVDLDGTQFGSTPRTGVRAPALLMGSENSCVTGTCHPRSAAERSARSLARSLLAKSSGPVWCYEIEGSQHFDYTDLAAFYYAGPIRRFLPLGSVGSRALVVQNTYVRAFLDHAVRGSREPLLTAGARPYPEVRTLRTP